MGKGKIRIPWAYDETVCCIEDAEGFPIDHDQSKYAVSCVNALRRIEDPKAFMEAVREAVRVFENFNRHREAEPGLDRLQDAMEPLRTMLAAAESGREEG